MKFFSLAFAALLTSQLCGSEEEKPNIILIYTDDHGWPDIGPAGIYHDLKTPHLDALAASGIRATNGYSSAPQCIPSRAGLLAGRYQNRFNVEANGKDLSGFDAELTIAERLKKVGYTTAQIGKWHLGPGNAIDQHGFDYFYNKNRDAPCPANVDREGNKIPVRNLPQTSYHLDDCSDMARTLIRKHKDDPFFIYLAYRAPHVPLDAPKKYLDRFPGEMPQRRRQALAMISAMDDGVGAIVAELKAHNLTEKTLIFYIGDNGAPLKIHKIDAPGGGPGWDGSLNKPMNGEKGMLAEGGIRVPFLISWPGTLPANTVYHQPIIALDATATTAHLAGADHSGFDGLNLIPHLKANTLPERTLFWRWIDQAAIRDGKWKLLRGGDRQYLFDLDTDPGESNNLFDKHPDIVERLHTQLSTWSSDLTPAGLPSGKMSATWDRYFDFYLDGKDVPKPTAKKEKAHPQSNATIRNGSHELKDGSLHITPLPASKQAPFLVKNQLNLNGPFTATVNIRASQGGPLGISWRTSEQKDFFSGKETTTQLAASTEWQTLTLEVPAKSTTVHLRLLLPNHPVQIGTITLKDATNTITWTPGKN
ncbi:MAG: sulfatase family protein [Verrucomicrobiaceae bacterium]